MAGAFWTSWISARPHGFEYVPAFNADESPADMADFIEYANRPADSQWVAVRVADGQPGPVQVEISGDRKRREESTTHYYAKVAAMAPAIWAKDANVILVVGDFLYSRPISDPFHFKRAASGITSLAAHWKICNWPKSTIARSGSTFM